VGSLPRGHFLLKILDRPSVAAVDPELRDRGAPSDQSIEHIPAAIAITDSRGSGMGNDRKRITPGIPDIGAANRSA